MTQRQFNNEITKWEKEIKRLEHRAALLRRVKHGDAKLKKVEVDGYWVRRHYVDPHDRYIEART
jgi:hypothetical protein